MTATGKLCRLGLMYEVLIRQCGSFMRNPQLGCDMWKRFARSKLETSSSCMALPLGCVQYNSNRRVNK